MKVLCIIAPLVLLPGCSLEFSGNTDRVVDIGQCHVVIREHRDIRAHVNVTKCGPGVAGALCRVLRGAK